MVFTIYTKDNCPYCKMAKQAVEQTGNTFIEIQIGNGSDEITSQALQEHVVNAGSSAIIKSVPQIFLEDKYIGGATDLVKFLRSL